MPQPLLRRVLRLLGAVALVASVFATVGTEPARADTTTTMTATPGATGEVTLRWAAPSGVSHWVVVAKRASDGQRLAMQTVCGTCTTAMLRHLTPGVAYRFAIGGVGRADGTVWGAANLTLPADPLCGTSKSCVAVDAMSSTGPATGVGRGLLMGLTSRTDQSRLAEVGLGYHRIDALNAAQFTAARSAGGAIDVVISAAWTTYTRNTLGRQMNPWEDWDLYRAVVANTVWWHQQQGLVPDYWEIQNEPDQAAWYKTSTPGMEPTTARILEQFRVAHDTIRAVLPSAKIVGPSVGIVDPPPRPLLDLSTFLDHVVANGLTFDVIAWHELTGSCGGGCDLGPRSVAQHVAAVRQMIALRPALGTPELHVNEFGGPGNIHQAGATVGYFTSLVAGGVDRAGSACWPANYDGRAYDGCYHDPGTMDNILMPDGRTPTANWHVWEAYADMAGQHRRASVSHLDMSVLAGTDAGGGVVALVGSHPEATGTGRAIDLKLRVGTAARKARVEVVTLAGTAGVVTPTTRTYDVSVSNGRASLAGLSVPAGGALLVTVTGTALLEDTATSTTTATMTTAPEPARR